MAAFGGPRAEEVVGHEVHGIEVLSGPSKVDIFQNGFSRGESSGEDVTILGKVDADRGQ